MKQTWEEHYRGCGCTRTVAKRAELLGYCTAHGNPWASRHWERSRIGGGGSVRVFFNTAPRKPDGPDPLGT